ncbi:hypothetical protein M422DRAFT_53459 [Sphaerobolus stellatus SS14]|uniref:Trafficking protein particle complex subunit 11 domain-containing protein n=1 Tax=Sphaerobolus stellatus (strain SS14) TaxID=990650 RepID=A0A0C9V1C3_SPHS4|nr:hypothetical protein M422DRAFT_53459 [Sphaerobolus stellatus SS14]
MEIPTMLPTYPVVLTPTPVPQALINPNEPAKITGLNPSTVLQHPGYYYYTAAICTQRRLERFLIADQEANLTDGVPVPNIANERKVDHKVIILELYRKTYELFKRHGYGQNQNRFTYHVAYRIAQMYNASGQPETAIKFYERITKIYKREHWDTLLKPVLSDWYNCCRQIGDTDTAVSLLIEMMCYGRGVYFF